MLSLFRDQAEQAVYSKSYDIFVEVDCDEQPDIQHYYGIKMVGIFWAPLQSAQMTHLAFFPPSFHTSWSFEIGKKLAR